MPKILFKELTELKLKMIRDDILAVLLAGGKSRRMGGGDKSLQKLAGEPLLSHVINRIKPQTNCMIINANGNPKRFASFGLEVVNDVVPGQQGPLAGVLTGLEWAIENKPNIQWVLSVPTDAPFLPFDLVDRLFLAICSAESLVDSNALGQQESNSVVGACALSGGRRHPVVALWPLSWRDQLWDALVSQGIKKIDDFTHSQALEVAEFSSDPIDPFTNINTLPDLNLADELLEANRMLNDLEPK